MPLAVWALNRIKRGELSSAKQAALGALAGTTKRAFVLPTLGMMEHLFRRRRQRTVERVADTPTNPEVVILPYEDNKDLRLMNQLRNQRGGEKQDGTDLWHRWVVNRINP